MKLPKIKLNKNLQKNLGLGIGTVLIAVLSFYMGSVTTELRVLKSGGLATAPSLGGAAQGTPPSQEAGDVDPISEADHIRGGSNAKVALIEYSDYECPYCQSFHPTAQQAVAEFGDDFMWVYRHFPLESIHPSARGAAIASECVAATGGNDAFWAFTDGVLAGSSLSETSLVQTASELGYDISSCLENRETETLVDEDIESGIRANVRGTPGNFVMNLETGETVMLGGAVPYAQLKQAIEGVL